MKFDDLDQEMRVFETAGDRCVLPDIYMVARIDGRNFTRLTKDVHSFEAPFDERFREFMLQTVDHLFGCGFRATFGFTQSDEISLLFHRDENSFGRKTRKFNSVLAGEASAKFSLQLGAIAAFDCRVCELPTSTRVRDYFRWRQEDAHRNALSGHCYWMLRKQGWDVSRATAKLRGMNVSEKNELLFQHGVNYNDLPLWQKRGVGIYWEEFDHPATNPITQQPVIAKRRRLRHDLELPSGDGFGLFVDGLIQRSERSGDQPPSP
jgi:tRNA(His) guanylyltransferase